jgi:hypothetical protein
MRETYFPFVSSIIYIFYSIFKNPIIHPKSPINQIGLLRIAKMYIGTLNQVFLGFVYKPNKLINQKCFVSWYFALD